MHYIGSNMCKPRKQLARPTGPGTQNVLLPENGTVYEIDGGANAVSRRVRAGKEALSMQLSPAVICHSGCSIATRPR